MTNTTFINQQTVIQASWAQDVNNRVYRTRTFELQMFGAACNGVTDDTAAVQLAIATLGSGQYTLIVPGPTKISTSCTFGGGTILQFSPGAYLTGNSGTELVTVQQPIQAGRWQIFKHCLAIATNGMVVAPEWFGALRDGVNDDAPAINSSYYLLTNVGGTISLAPGTYGLQTSINASIPKVNLLGAGVVTTNLNMLNTSHEAIDCIGVQGTPIATPVFTGFSVNCTPTQSTTTVGINLNYTALAKLTDIQVNGFLYGYNQIGATNTFFTRCGASYAGVVSGFIGFNINGSNNVGGNASSVYRDCYVQSSDTQGTGCIAFHAYGDYVSDLYFSNCASARCNYGYVLDYSSAMAGGYSDIVIQNPVVDFYTAQGIQVINMPANQKLTIQGGWINSASVGVETDAFYVSGCLGQISISNAQVQGEGNVSNVMGVRVINSRQLAVQGCMFSNCVRAVYETGSAACIYQGNTVSNLTNSAANMMYLVGTTGALVQGNSFAGNASSIILVDNTSSSASVIGNIMTQVVAASRISNNAATAVGGANGSTGLNLGY